MQPDPDTYLALSSMLTPAIFLTVNGSLIISTSNRVSRVNDRIHQLNDIHDKLSRGRSDLDFPDSRIKFAEKQLRALIRRGNQIRYSLAMQYASFALFVATSLVLAVDVWTGHMVTFLPTTTAIGGVLLMLGSSVNLVREAWAAIASNQSEIEFFEELHVRRRAAARVEPDPGNAP